MDNPDSLARWSIANLKINHSINKYDNVVKTNGEHDYSEFYHHCQSPRWYKVPHSCTRNGGSSMYTIYWCTSRQDSSKSSTCCIWMVFILIEWSTNCRHTMKGKKLPQFQTLQPNAPSKVKTQLALLKNDCRLFNYLYIYCMLAMGQWFKKLFSAWEPCTSFISCRRHHKVL